MVDFGAPRIMARLRVKKCKRVVKGGGAYEKIVNMNELKKMYMMRDENVKKCYTYCSGRTDQ
jgi:hypothetical protein